MKRFLLAVPLVALVPAAAVYSAAVHQRPHAGAVEIANAPHERNSIEFQGRILQNVNRITSYGYLTHVSGLSDALVFASQTKRNETTARFTYVAHGRINNRFVNNNMIVTTSVDHFNVFYHRAPGSNWDAPSSFATGRHVATIYVRDQNMLNVQAPDAGIALGAGDATEQSAGVFRLGGHPYRFGHRLLRDRFTTTGEGHRTQVQPPKSTFVIAGNAVMVP